MCYVAVNCIPPRTAALVPSCDDDVSSDSLVLMVVLVPPHFGGPCNGVVSFSSSCSAIELSQLYDGFVAMVMVLVLVI